MARLKLHSVADSEANFYEHGFLQAICLTILLLRFVPQHGDLSAELLSLPLTALEVILEIGAFYAQPEHSVVSHLLACLAVLFVAGSF